MGTRSIRDNSIKMELSATPTTISLESRGTRIIIRKTEAAVHLVSVSTMIYYCARTWQLQLYRFEEIGPKTGLHLWVNISKISRRETYRDIGIELEESSI